MKVTHHSDNQVSRKDMQRGAALSGFESAHTWERCVVVGVQPNNYTMDVYTERGSYLSGLPWPGVSSSSSNAGGEITVPKRGQQFGVHYHLGVPTIVEAPAQAITSDTKDMEQRVTTIRDVGGESGQYSNTVNNAFRLNRPADVIGGDWIRMGSDGNLVGVLEGGVTLFKASELAQIIAAQGGDLLRLIGRNMDIMTGFGEIKFRNEGGNVSMSLKGGSHLNTETSPLTDDNFTIHLDMGETGELVNFRVTNPRGQTLASINYKPDGSIVKVTEGSVEETIAQSENKTVGLDSITEVVGNKVTRVGREQRTEVQGSMTETTFGTKTSYAGNDQNIGAQRDINISAGHKMHVKAIGDFLSKPGDVAMDVVIANGSLVFDVGNPAAGDLQKSLSGFKVTTYLGDIDLTSLLANINIITTIPESVHIGGPVPIFHAMLYETFKAFIEAFGALVDSHVHPTGVGPSGPPVVMPFTTTKAGVELIRSMYVRHGG